MRGVDERVAAAVIESVRARLRARGSPPVKVVVEGSTLVIGAGEGRRAIPIAELLGAWNLLPPEDRARRIDALLARSGRAAGSAASSPAAARLVVAWSAALLLALGAIASVAWARGEAVSAAGRRQAREARPPSAPDEAPSAAASRREAICAGVRRRVLAGASFGPYDAEGWVVELWLAREDGKLGPDHAQLASIDEEGGLARFDPELARLRGTITVGELAPPPASVRAARPGGALVSMHGALATAFVDPSMRARFPALADRLYDATGAELGGLWARCGDLPWHDLGAWFRGVDPGAAAGALLFGSGRYGEGGAVHPTAPSGAANTLGALVTRSRAVVDERALELGVVDLGGKVQTLRGAGTTITFPLAAYTLATRSSREIAALVDRGAP
jgi:serine/threonine-protein kinase